MNPGYAGRSGTEYVRTLFCFGYFDLSQQKTSQVYKIDTFEFFQFMNQKLV
jgi:hypothetical protein